MIAYATWMRSRVAPVTARIWIEDLGLTLNLIDPRYDRKLLKTTVDRLPKTSVRDKRRRLRDPVEFIALGERLMAEAEAGAMGPPRHNAVAYRDGLIIALLAWRPLRRHNLAALRMAEHLREFNGSLRIAIAGVETKARNPIDPTWPKSLLAPLQRYLSHWRPICSGITRTQARCGFRNGAEGHSRRTPSPATCAGIPRPPSALPSAPIASATLPPR